MVWGESYISNAQRLDFHSETYPQNMVLVSSKYEKKEHKYGSTLGDHCINVEVAIMSKNIDSQHIVLSTTSAHYTL